MISSSNSNTAFLSGTNNEFPSGKSSLCQICSLMTVNEPDEIVLPGNDDAIVRFLVARILPDDPPGDLGTHYSHH